MNYSPIRQTDQNRRRCWSTLKLWSVRRPTTPRRECSQFDGRTDSDSQTSPSNSPSVSAVFYCISLSLNLQNKTKIKRQEYFVFNYSCRIFSKIKVYNLSETSFQTLCMGGQGGTGLSVLLTGGARDGTGPLSSFDGGGGGGTRWHRAY